MNKSPFKVLEQDKTELYDNEPVDSRTRGVINPKVIDLISFNRQSDQVELSVFEYRSYPSYMGEPINLESYERERELLLQLEEKLNNYLTYVLDGFLVKHYPQYQGKKVVIIFEHNSVLSPLASKFVKDFQGFISKSTNINFLTNHNYKDSY
jgi:hypothetical protein